MNKSCSPLPSSPRWFRPGSVGRLLAGIAAGWLSMSGALAKSPGPVTEDTNGEVITLPEFQVSAEQQRDAWIASQAMSGTRTAAPILELPYQVQVLTQEFLEDFQLVGLTEQLSFFSAYSGVADQADAAIGGTLAGSSIRGFPQTVLRDGFRRTPPPQIGNTSQVEVIKGPISTLYGDASPGGLINYVSKRPTLRPAYSLSITAGNYDYLRTALNVSGPLYKKRLYYLIVADNYKRNGEIRYTKADNADYLFSLLFKPTDKTSLSVSYEIVHLTGTRAGTQPSLVINTTATTTRPGLSWTGGIVTGYDRELAEMRYSRYGPDEHYFRNYDGLNLMLEHSYNSNWKQRVGYQGQWKSFDQNLRTSSNVSAVTGRMNDVRPNRRLQDIDGPVSLQSDLLGHFTTGKLKHALLFTADYAEEQTNDIQLRLNNQQVRDLLPDSYRYPDPYNQDWSTQIDYGALGTLGAKNYEDIKFMGGAVSDRIFIGGGKLVLMGSVRYDKSEFATDTSTTTNILTYGSAECTTHSAGANWKIKGDSLVFFANHSTSFNTNVTIDRNLHTTIPNEEGEGTEAGFKALALENRLGLTVSGYEIEKKNIGQTNPDFVLGDAMPEFLGYGRERVRGVDGDVNFTVTKSFTILGSLSYLDAKVLASSNASLAGTRKLQVPHTTASLAFRYKFDGRLKGLIVGASYRYTGEYVRANATATRWYEAAPAREIVGAFVGYKWKQGKYSHTMRLNANNLLDEFYVGPDLYIGLGRQVNFTYTFSYR
jgi:outer membrane receptor protein involved in Fe transport